MSCTTQLLRHSRKVVFIFIFFRLLSRKVNLKFADVAMNYHFVCQFLILSDSLLCAFLFGKIRLVKMIMALQLIFNSCSLRGCAFVCWVIGICRCKCLLLKFCSMEIQNWITNSLIGSGNLNMNLLLSYHHIKYMKLVYRYYLHPCFQGGRYLLNYFTRVERAILSHTGSNILPPLCSGHWQDFVELIIFFEFVQLRSAQNLLEVESVSLARYFSKDANTFVSRHGVYIIGSGWYNWTKHSQLKSVLTYNFTLFNFCLSEMSSLRPNGLLGKRENLFRFTPARTFKVGTSGTIYRASPSLICLESPNYPVPFSYVELKIDDFWHVSEGNE